MAGHCSDNESMAVPRNKLPYLMSCFAVLPSEDTNPAHTNRPFALKADASLLCSCSSYNEVKGMMICWS